MSTTGETTKDIVRRYTEEGYNETDTDVIGETVAEDVVVTGLPQTDGPVRGIDEYLGWVSMTFEAFSDFHIEMEELVAEGNTAAVGWTISATQDGPLGDIPATGESYSVDAQAILRIEDGEIVEKRFVMDELGMLVQLGVME